MSYLDDLQQMPPEVQAIAMKCWDDTGRPLSDDTYLLAVVNLLNLCNDLDEYKVRYDQLFGYNAAARSINEVTSQWHCFVAGLLRGIKEMEKIVKES